MASGSGTGTGSSQPDPANPNVEPDVDDDDSFSALDEERLRRYPLWKHVKLVERHGNSGGNAKSVCLYCNHGIPGSYSRVRAHLMKEAGKGTSICSAVTPEMLEVFRKQELAAKAVTDSASRRSVPMPKKKQTGILESFHLELRQMADALIARISWQ
ncbi:hypothetical protein ACP70R_001331 [Stipagrostis hirtigluma subsp. patula]